AEPLGADEDEHAAIAGGDVRRHPDCAAGHLAGAPFQAGPVDLGLAGGTAALGPRPGWTSRTSVRTGAGRCAGCAGIGIVAGSGFGVLRVLVELLQLHAKELARGAFRAAEISVAADEIELLGIRREQRLAFARRVEGHLLRLAAGRWDQVDIARPRH